MIRSGCICAIAVASLIFALSAGWAQSTKAEEDLRSGLASFKQEQYLQAVTSFKKVLADSGSPYAPDAYFWSAKAYMAVEMFEDAERNLEQFIANYPQHPYRMEAQYQRGRLLFLQKDYEKAIQACEEFIRQHPKSEFVPNSYFWTAESLYFLGKLDEAARVYSKVTKEYPQSFKVEASRYRLSLIEFKKREDELLRLLKWSHEELIKAVEEFKRREKAYEQAIAAYQKKLSSGGEPSRQLEELKAENASLRGRLQGLESKSPPISSQPATDTAAKQQELANWERALQIKAEALALKEALLLRYEAKEESER